MKPILKTSLAALGLFTLSAFAEDAGAPFTVPAAPAPAQPAANANAAAPATDAAPAKSGKHHGKKHRKGSHKRHGKKAETPPPAAAPQN